VRDVLKTNKNLYDKILLQVREGLMNQRIDFSVSPTAEEETDNQLTEAEATE
jgi:hypothetical protein